MKKILLAAALAVMPSLSQAAVNLVVNGSFEIPAVINTKVFNTTSIAGWALVSGPKIEMRNNRVGVAQDGSNFIELDSTANSTIAQIISTTAGQFYDISFWYSPRGNVSAASNPIAFSWNGSLVDIVTGTNNTLGNVWSQYTFHLAASTAYTSLMFAAVGISDGLGGALDNVSVSVSSVPEPETYAMLLAGLGLLGFTTRRRSKLSA